MSRPYDFYGVGEDLAGFAVDDEVCCLIVRGGLAVDDDQLSAFFFCLGGERGRGVDYQ